MRLGTVPNLSAPFPCVKQGNRSQSGAVLQITGDNMCLALGSKQLLNIITCEYLFIGDVQMSEFLVCFFFFFFKSH